jgi:hypothetical protein
MSVDVAGLLTAVHADNSHRRASLPMTHLTYAEAMIVGLVQGVTELFPVSRCCPVAGVRR